MRCVECFKRQTSSSFPLEEGLFGINQLLATERAKGVTVKERK